MPLLKTRPPDPPSEATQTPRTPQELLGIVRSHPSEAARRNAALDLTGVLEAAPGLVAALERETAWSVREAIVTALIATGTSTAVTGLARFLRSEDSELRNAAVEALRHMGSLAGAHMAHLIVSPEPDLRIFAIDILQVLPTPGTRALLRDVLAYEQDMNVGLAAVEAMAQLGEPGDEPALQAFTDRFPGEPFVQFAVEVACRRIGAGAW